MENAKEKIEWTEETVRPYIFKMVEVNNGSGAWHKVKLMSFKYNYIARFIDNDDCCYKFMRPIAEKKQVIEPWTFDTCPWPLFLKYNQGCLAFSTKKSNGVVCDGAFYAYGNLAELFTQLDGSPCGIVREVDA